LGATIDVWNDQCIPSNTSLKPLVRLNLANVVLVSDLFLANKKMWNHERLQENFIPSDMDVILKIPLTIRLMHDIEAWAYERNGCYSVRSAYRLAMEIQCVNADYKEGVSSGSMEEGLWWKHMWKIKIPPKVRIFWWRAIHNFLPANEGNYQI
jgi:hypothetical protein